MAHVNQAPESVRQSSAAESRGRPGALRRAAAALLLLLGTGLLGINMYGLVASYPEIPQAAWDMGPIDRIRDRPSWEEMTIRPGESREEFFRRMTTAIDEYFIHYGNPDVPIWDNYILWGLTQAGFPYFYERADVDRALDRGRGQCSQFSLILAGILEENDIPARVVRLSGHVVASGQTAAGDWQILDANYGVVMPYSIDVIQQTPEMVEPYYRDIYRIIPERVRLPMVEIFGPENNRSFTVEAQKGWKAYWAERLSGVLIWVIPAFLFVGAWLLARHPRRPA